MMINNLTGLIFGRLTVVAVTTRRDSKGHVIWACACSCGETHQVSSRHLQTGMVKSCGCLRSDTAKERGFGRKRRVIGRYSSRFDDLEEFLSS